MAGHLSALIVSDSDQLQNSLHILLRSIPQFGNIHLASDGPPALAFGRGLEPSLVLLDYDVSRNGRSGALDRIKAEWPEAVCMALADNESQVERAAKSGADVVVMKGVLAAKLLETIEELLNA